MQTLWIAMAVVLGFSECVSAAVVLPELKTSTRQRIEQHLMFNKRSYTNIGSTALLPMHDIIYGIARLVAIGIIPESTVLMNLATNNSLATLMPTVIENINNESDLLNAIDVFELIGELAAFINIYLPGLASEATINAALTVLSTLTYTISIIENSITATYTSQNNLLGVMQNFLEFAAYLPRLTGATDNNYVNAINTFANIESQGLTQILFYGPLDASVGSSILSTIISVNPYAKSLFDAVNREGFADSIENISVVMMHHADLLQEISDYYGNTLSLIDVAQQVSQIAQLGESIVQSPYADSTAVHIVYRGCDSLATTIRQLFNNYFSTLDVITTTTNATNDLATVITAMVSNTNTSVDTLSEALPLLSVDSLGCANSSNQDLINVLIQGYSNCLNALYDRSVSLNVAEFFILLQCITNDLAALTSSNLFANNATEGSSSNCNDLFNTFHTLLNNINWYGGSISQGLYDLSNDVLPAETINNDYVAFEQNFSIANAQQTMSDLASYVNNILDRL